MLKVNHWIGFRALSPILGGYGVLTAFSVVFIHHRIKVPKLVVGGGGGGGTVIDGERFASHLIHLRSSPRFFGYPVNRETLSVQSALIYDPEKKTYEGGQMRWQGTPENEPFRTQIKVGERAELFVCGVYKQRVHHYAGDTLHNIDHSDTLVEIGNTRKLEIHVNDTLGRKYKIRFKISSREHRSSVNKVQVSIRTKLTLADRFWEFKSGFHTMISAFTHPSY